MFDRRLAGNPAAGPCRHRGARRDGQALKARFYNADRRLLPARIQREWSVSMATTRRDDGRGGEARVDEFASVRS